MENFKNIIINEGLDNFCQSRKLFSHTNKDYEDLVLLKYKREESNLDDENSSKCRGIILDKNNMSPVFYGLDARKEYTIFKQNHSFDNVSVTRLYDGTMLNLYYYKDKWILSTKSRIDAKKSYWANSKSFYELFTDIVTVNYDNLDKNLCYSFVMLNQNNIIVKKHNTNKVYLVLARNLTTNEIVTTDVDCTKMGKNIFQLETLNDFKSYDELEEHISNSSIDDVGYMLYSKDGERSKIYVPEFLKVKNYEANHFNYVYRFLRLKKNKEITDFLSYYPEQSQKHSEVKNNIKLLLTYILNLYHKSRIEYIEFPKYIARHIYNLDTIYKNNKKNKVKYPNINFKIINSYFDNLDIKTQYHLLKNWNSQNIFTFSQPTHPFSD